MKFMIPQNYNRTNKLFGFINYSSAILFLLWAIFLFCIVNFIFKSLYIKIFVFIIFCVPFFIFCIIGFNQENIISFISYFFKFIFSQKLYLYQKSDCIINKKMI